MAVLRHLSAFTHELFQSGAVDEGERDAVLAVLDKRERRLEITGVGGRAGQEGEGQEGSDNRVHCWTVGADSEEAASYWGGRNSQTAHHPPTALLSIGRLLCLPSCRPSVEAAPPQCCAALPALPALPAPRHTGPRSSSGQAARCASKKWPRWLHSLGSRYILSWLPLLRKLNMLWHAVARSACTPLIFNATHQRNALQN